MANCEFYLELMSQSLDGALTDEAQKALDEHLRQCPDCRVLHQQLCDVHSELSSWEEQAVPEGFTQGVMSRVRALESSPKRLKVVPLWKRPSFKALGSVAACAVVCLGIWRMDLLSGTDSAAGAAIPSVSPAEVAAADAPAAQSEQPEQKMWNTAAAPLMGDVARSLPEEDGFTYSTYSTSAEIQLSTALPNADDLLQSVSAVLDCTPGTLFVLKDIPPELDGTWYSTENGHSFLVVQFEDDAQLPTPESSVDEAAVYEQLSSAALLSLSQGEGPLVLVHWT